uniref:MFS n=1 Tax=Paecilomyces fulvus TaxID=89137 RepID=A0A172WCU8_9EURO|nr:MFS [Paecilomyces fulvus]
METQVGVTAEARTPEVTTEATPLLEARRSSPPYSIFTSRQKRLIILAAAIASTFSPFSANIYYPALNSIAADLGVNNAQVNLTITTYMICQGLAPTFMGSFADTAGRRPTYIICFVIYICANVALATQHSYALLLVFRAIQSSGSSGTVALASAVAADVVTSAERGTYLALTTIGTILAPSLGPIIGGLLSQYLGWRAVFWFLAVAASVFCIPFFLFYPETCRAVVGDGSIPPPPWNMSLLDYLRRRRTIDNIRLSQQQQTVLHHKPAPKRGYKFPNPFFTLRLLFQLPTGLVLAANGVVFASYYSVTSSMPSQFKSIYGLNDLGIGLVFVPAGLGTLCSTLLNGSLVDWNYRRLKAAAGTPVVEGQKQDNTDFPIEKARLQIALPMMFLGAVVITIYGWVMAEATAMAANNLVRCLLGAAATAIVHPMINVLGRGWTYTYVGATVISIAPVLLLVLVRGLGWRKEREARGL